jgi:hypothetical protein
MIWICWSINPSAAKSSLCTALAGASVPRGSLRSPPLRLVQPQHGLQLDQCAGFIFIRTTDVTNPSWKIWDHNQPAVDPIEVADTAPVHSTNVTFWADRYTVFYWHLIFQYYFALDAIAKSLFHDMHT